MLECQRNGESSFAVSASTCMYADRGRKGEGQSGEGADSGREGARGQGREEKLQRRERERQGNARACACTGPVSASVLSAVLIPAIFN